MAIPRLKYQSSVAYLSFIFFLSLSLILTPFLSSDVLAIPGDLDPTFDDDGITTYSGAGGLNILDVGDSLFVNGDDEIFVNGRVYGTGGGGIGMGVWKYDENGDLDTSFSGDGIDTRFDAGGGGGQDSGRGIVEDSNGRVIALSETYSTGSQFIFALHVYTSSGNLDTTFSGDGKYLSNSYSGSQMRPYGVTVDSNNKVYVVGRFNGNMSVWRFNTNGTLDTSFDSDGVVSPINGYARDVEIDSEGRVVVGGRSYNSSQSRWEHTVFRLETDGSLDTDFSGDGIFTYFFSGDSPDYLELTGISVGSNDEIAATGHTSVIDGGGATLGVDMYTMLIEENGDLDTSFDSDGIARYGYSTSDEDYSQGRNVEFDTNGNIVVSGKAKNSGQNFSPIVLRYLPDGSLDTDFSEDGVANSFAGGSEAGNGENDALDLDSNGRIVLTGSTVITGVHHMTIWRFRGGELNTVGVDIRPGECENLVDVDSTGVLTVAINGTSSFDVTDIDPDSVKLEDASPLQSFVQDMSDSGDCDEFADTYDDLIVRFRISDLPASLQSLTTGQTADLDLTADLYGEDSISGTDTIEVIND
jgi:uncharacterized delta-60 repeat protein